jgi:hypothetical protein
MGMVLANSPKEVVSAGAPWMVDGSITVSDDFGEVDCLCPESSPLLYYENDE